MKQEIEKVLYWDPQQSAASCCERCGGVIYSPGHHCIRYQRDGYDA